MIQETLTKKQNKEKSMSKVSRGFKAQNLLLNERGVDYIIDCNETPDFVQCICSIGGDVVTFRVYDDGTTTQK